MPLTPIALKQYIAALSQTGTNAPTATILKNTIGNIIWTRTGVGQYRATLAGAFPAGKTIMPPFDLTVENGNAVMLPVYNTEPNSYSYQITRQSANELWLSFYNNTDFEYVEWSSVPTPNGIIINIEVYN